jgi:hypothetical protein
MFPAKNIIFPLSGKRFRILSALVAIFFATSHAPAQETVEQWKAKAIEKYPDIAIPGSLFNKQFVAEYRRRQATDPKLLENPQWPMLIAQSIAKQLEAKIPGIDIPAEDGNVNRTQIKLLTGEDIKNRWIEQFRQPRTLDRDYHAVLKVNAANREAIQSGRYDDRANKEAARINMATLLAAGLTKEAEVVRQILAAHDANDARKAAEARENTQRILNQMRQDDMRRAIEQQNRELQDLSHQVRQLRY